MTGSKLGIKSGSEHMRRLLDKLGKKDQIRKKRISPVPHKTNFEPYLSLLKE